MSRAFFTPCGKSCHVFLPMISAKTVANTLRQEVTLLSTLYLLSITIGNASWEIRSNYLSLAQSVMPRHGAPPGMKEDILGEKAARARTGR